MEENRSQSLLVKTIFILASIIMFGLMAVGIIQTFVHNGMLSQQAQLEQNNLQIEQKIEETQKEIDIRESDEYQEDVLEQEHGYGKEGEVIVLPK